jgi:class 3 adenylate cyclase
MPFSKILNLFPENSAEHQLIVDAVKSHQKLQKTLDRLVKHSDRFEEELRKTSQNLKQKNEFLEILTNRLSKYLSPQLFNSIFESKTLVNVGTQRKKLTVFFSDIANFTAISEQSQPEVLTLYLNEYLAEMSNIALAFGATIDKFIGDSIMIFFGDPETLGEKQDAIQCVKMGIAMQEKMVGLRIKWAKMGFAHPFRVRIGINTGFCNVGNFGFENRMEYTIIGGSVNLASRLESLSDVDGILISQETHSLVEDEVHCEAREPIAVKGLARTVKTFAVKSLRNGADLLNANLITHNGHSLPIDWETLTLIEKQTLKYQLMKIIDMLDT